MLAETPPAQPGLTFRQQIARLDLPGTAVLLPCIVCLLLALQWGGQQYAWSDGRVIALLVVFGVLLILFVAIQIWQQDRATIPPRIIKQRSVIAVTWFAFFLGSAFLLPIYYISIWFQAIKGDTAVHSGISTIPLLLAFVFSSIGGGVAVMRIGYYKPFMIMSAVLAPISLGLFSLFKTNTTHSMWIGVQVFFGFSLGCGFQQTNIAVQAILPKADAPVGISLVFFAQTLGPTIFVAVCQNVLDNHLIKKLAGLNGLTGHQIINTGATSLRNVFSSADLPYVLHSYNEGIVQVFYVGVAVSSLTILGALAMPNKSVKRGNAQPAQVKKADEEQPAEKNASPNVSESAEGKEIATGRRSANVHDHDDDVATDKRLS